MAKKHNNSKNSNGANLGFEATLWAAADKLRNNMDAAEYKHVVLGLIFLKYISDAFIERYNHLKEEVQNPDSEYYVGNADKHHIVLEDRDEYLAEVKGMPHKNLAVELLQKLLNDEIKIASRKNLVKARSFAEMLERTIKSYKNRAVEAAKIIEELIALAREMREANKRGEKLGLADDELAFYDALETNDSAVKILGDDILKSIARELVERVKKNVAIDWEVKESVRAKLRTIVKRILRKYGYPPDKQEKATLTVLKQTELLCKEWVA